MNTTLKKSFFLVFCLASTLSYAQKFNVKAGLNLATMLREEKDITISDDYAPRAGAYLAGAMELQAPKLFALETVLSVQNRGFIHNVKADTAAPRYHRIAISLIYIDLALNVKLFQQINENLTFFIKTGPYVGLGVRAEGYAETNDPNLLDSQYIYSWGKLSGDEYRHFDVGLGIAGGVQFKRILFDLGTEIGMRNLIPPRMAQDEDIVAKNRLWRFTIGYLLN